MQVMEPPKRDFPVSWYWLELLKIDNVSATWKLWNERKSFKKSSQMRISIL